MAILIMINELYTMEMKGTSQNPMTVIAVMGLPGSGKSYFAARLAKAIGSLYISSDQVRNTVPGPPLYDLHSKEKIYHEMCLQMERSLRKGKSVVLDATFYRKQFRDLFREKSAAYHVPLYFIETVAAEEVIRERLQKRLTDSAANYETYQKIKKHFEHFGENHLILHSDRLSAAEMLNLAHAYTG